MIGMAAIPLRAWLAAAAALALIASHGCIYLRGRADGGTAMQARYVQAAARAAEAAKRRQARIDAIEVAQAAAAAHQTTETRTIYHETQRIIDRPIYRAECVDADGVGLLDRAAANANHALAGGAAGDAP